MPRTCPTARRDNKILTVALLVFGVIILFFVMSDLRHPHIYTMECSEDLRPQLVANYNPDQETIYCLIGIRDGNHLKIHGMYTPEQEGTMFEVTYKRCNHIGSVGTLHTQPEGYCSPSQDDIYTFGRSKDAVFGIMCGPEKIIFWNQDMELVEVQNK